MKKALILRIFSALLCCFVLFSTVPAEALVKERAAFVSRLNYDIDGDTVLRAVVLYDGDGAISLSSKGKAPNVVTASKRIAEKQNALVKSLENCGAEVLYSYSAILNGAGIEATYAQLKEIERIDGVSAVYIANTYSVPTADVAVASSAAALTYAQTVGKGAGAVVAVLDTGFRLTHEVFSTSGVEAALTKTGMEAIRDGARGLNGNGVYVSEKIPFAYDYYGKDTDVSTTVSHGTAVAGIAVGNGGGYEGAAPRAQLLAMKIFDDKAGQTDSAVYFAALEDAYLLGADVINLSLGSQNGFVYDSELEGEVFGNIYETLKSAGIFVFGAAGNEYSQGYKYYAYNHASTSNGIDAVTADYADYGVIASPASYDEVIAVGSFESGTGKPSGFSSMGCTPELVLKPEISGIGGSVRCAVAYGNSSYTYMSGTSMATPAVAGAFAALKAYYRRLPAYEGLTDDELYKTVYGQMLSFADYTDGVSPRKQGAGLVAAGNIGGGYFADPIVNLGSDSEKRGVYSFTVTAYGIEAGATLTFTGAQVLADYLIDYDGVSYNTLTSRALGASVTVDSESYALSDTATAVTVTVTLSDSDREYLEGFENGGFVEGYIQFSVNGENNGPHITFMGFYGDWCAGSAFEKYDWRDVAEAERYLNTTLVDGSDKTYAESGYTYLDLLEMNVGYSEGYLRGADGNTVGMLGDNLYAWVKYDEKHIAFSTAAASGAHLAEGFVIYPSLLRNVRNIIMTVRNSETDEVYYTDDTEYAPKNYYDTDDNVFAQGTYFMWDGTYVDADGGTQYVASGTEVIIRFQTRLAFEGAPLVTAAEYRAVVDNEAPKLDYSWNMAEKKLTVTVSDSHYISNIFVHDGSYSTLYVNDAVEEYEKGESLVRVYDLSELLSDTEENITLEVQDYATNSTSVVIPLSYLLGDVNADGYVNSIDAACILKYSAGIYDIAPSVLPAGDMNGDGAVNSTDAAIILKYAAGI